MEAQHRSAGETYVAARHAFEDLIAQLSTQPDPPRSHSDVEETIRVLGNEILRRLYQGYLQQCAAEDRRRADAQAAPTGQRVHAVARPIESLFGRVTLVRCADLATSGTTRDFPLDRALNLPWEIYSMPVRRSVAEFARGVSMEQTVQGIDRTTGAPVPKRQVEALVVRAAEDFEAFYAQRPVAANDTMSDKALLVMTCDSKGIAMVPGALRDATRKAADEARAAQPAHTDPMAPRKKRRHARRMAIVTAVYEQEPQVRTTEDVVQGLSRQPRDPARAPPPRPQRKTVAASVIHSPREGIRAMFEEAARRDPDRRRTTAVLVDGETRQQDEIRRQAKALGWTLTMIVDLIHVPVSVKVVVV